VIDDADRFAVIDALRVARISGRASDKRVPFSSRRFVRVVGNNSLILAACGCKLRRFDDITVCPGCGGAVLTDVERERFERFK
jgi:hypothetical protein